MSILESISVAVESLSANKMRTVLTMLGIIIGVGAVITMLALAQGARERMMSQIQQMGTNVLIVMSGQSRHGAVMGGFGSIQSLTLEDSEVIPQKCSSIDKVAPEVSSGAQVKYRNQNTNTAIIGCTPDFLDVRNYQVQDGRFFTQNEVKSANKVAVIGATAAKNLFGEESPIGKRIRVKGMPFDVVGLMAVKGAAGSFGDPDDQIYIPVTTAMHRVFGLQYVRAISAQAKSMSMMDQATAEITSLLRKRHRLHQDADDDFVIRSQAEFMQMANQAAGVFTLLLGGIASVSLLVGGIGIMNIMLVSVTERTREIGIRMAIGARRRDILNQFLIESVVLSLLGGAAGVLMGIGASSLIAKFSGWNVSVSLPSVLLSFGFAAMVGIFFGLYPARKASGLHPIDALRYE